MSWVLNAYAIVYASLLVLLGRLSEGRPRQNGFLLGVLLFTLASAACGAASSLGMLLAFRVLQAVGAALLTPTSLSLMLATTAPEKRHGAVRAWTAVGGGAAALGPVIGGLLVAASWRWVFYVNVPIGLAAVVIGWLRLPNVPGHPVKAPDRAGRGARHRRCRTAQPRPGRGEQLGLGLDPCGRRAPERAGDARCLRAAADSPRQSADRPVALQDPRIPRILDRGADLLNRVRGDAAVDRAVDAGRLALVGSAHGPRIRAGSTDGAAVRLRLHRPADRPLRPGARDRRGFEHLRDRRCLVGAEGGSRTQLHRTGASGDHAAPGSVSG